MNVEPVQSRQRFQIQTQTIRLLSQFLRRNTVSHVPLLGESLRETVQLKFEKIYFITSALKTDIKSLRFIGLTANICLVSIPRTE